MSEAEVRSAFAAWATAQQGAPGDVGSLVDRIDVAEEYVGLLATDVHGRRVVWKEVPVGGRTRVSAPVVTAESVDAWEAEPRSLRDRSEHVAVCEGCAGEGKRRCAVCGGAGKLLCGACGGQRKAYGYAANGSYRLLNCKACNGKGQLDCGECRRGIATCARCAGEGRLQRWLELEVWRRAATGAHRAELARQLGWSESPSDARIASDADAVADIDRPYRLAASDLGAVSGDWLRLLGPRLEPGERVARQHLRVARVLQYAVHYRLGGQEDSVIFQGHRLIGPPSGTDNLFVRRASRLLMTVWTLTAVGVGATIAALARGAFYRSTWTLLSLVAFAGVFGMLYGAVADWTSARRHLRRWLIAAASCLAVAAALTFIALPRRAHAEGLLRSNQLDAAAEELEALHDEDLAPLWADLWLARIRTRADIAAAQKALARIPSNAPQHASAVTALDDFILQTAITAMEQKNWLDAAAALAQLSDGATRRPDVVAAATSVFPPLVAQSITRKEWSTAADRIVIARRLGVASDALEPLIDRMEAAGSEAAKRAAKRDDARRRLLARQEAEQILVAWEKASERWGTAPLLSLRTAMARDVAAAEKAARKRRS